MNFTVPILLALCFFLVSCQDDETTNKAVFNTHEVSRSAEGASFRATISILEDTPYDGYGFVWSERRDPTVTDSVYTFNEAPVEGSFSIEVKNDLDPGTVYHVRAFLKSRSNVIYSNTVQFESLGSATPIITSFSPVNGDGLDTIQISGGNFSRLISNVQVRIGTTECEVLEASRQTLKVRLPAAYSSGSFPIEVRVSGKTAMSKDLFTLNGPVINSISPASGPAATIVTIVGENFSATASLNHVFVGSLPAQVLTASTTMLSIRVPEDANVEVKDISIELDGSTALLSKAFTLTGPEIISISPTNGVQGTIVTINGSGFSPIVAENRVSLGWDGYADVISASPEKLVVRIGTATYAGPSACLVTVHGATAVAKDEFTILGPEVTRIEPASQYGGRSVKLIGKNFKAEPYNTSAYFSGTGMDASIINLTDTEMEIALPYNLNEDRPIVLTVGRISYTTPFDVHVLSPWTKLPDFPGEARWAAVGFSIGQYGYVGTGVTSHGDLRDMWRFDSQNQTWKRMSDFPGSSRAFAISFVVDGKAYVGAGSHYGISWDDFLNNLYDLWEYDPADDSWTQKSSLPQWGMPSRMMVEAVSAGRNGYFCAGSYMFQYNVDADAWYNRYSPVSYQEIALEANGKLYFGLGPYYPYLYEYDPILTTWQDITTGVGSINFGSSLGFTINNKLYLGSTAQFIEYDPVTAASKILPLRTDLKIYAATFTIGNLGYVVTGVDGQGSKSFFTFNPNY